MSFSVKPAAYGPSATPGDQIRNPIVTSDVGTFVDQEAASGSQDAAVVADPVYAPEAPLYEPEAPLYATAVRLELTCALLTIASCVTLVGALGVPGSSWLIAFVVCYVLCLVEGLLLPFFGYTESTLNLLLTIDTHALGSSDAEHPLFRRMRVSRPRVQMYIECYHNEQVTRMNSDGDNETVTVRCVTHRAAEDKVFASWLDLSGVTPRLADVEARYVGLLVDVESKAELADRDTKSSFEAQAQAFVRAHKHMGVHYEFRETLEVDGFEPRVSVFAKDRMPYFVSPTAYVLATLLLLSWPYRLYVLQHVLKTTFKLRYQISVRPGAFAGIEGAVAVPVR